MGQLTDKAVAIRNERGLKQNSAERLGGLLQDLAEAVESFDYTPTYQVGLPMGELKFNGAIHKLVAPGSEKLYMYGVEWQTTNSDPDVTRIGNMDLHRELPIQNAMRGCLMADDGTIIKYLNPDDWSSEVRDGSMGQVMVEIPMHFVRFETEGTTLRVKMSAVPLEGYKLVPKMYVSAYHATVQRSNNKLASVVNLTSDFLGGNGTDTKFAGTAAGNLSLTLARQYARNRNNGDTQWNCHTYQVQRALTWLYVVEYATRNSQKDFDDTLTAEGFKQGGLGMGVSEFYDWSSYNNYWPFIPCGVTDTLGNKSGIVNYNVVKNGATIHTAPVNRYHGVEMPFGHLWIWTDGFLTGGDDWDDASAYVCDDPAYFADTLNEHYKQIYNGEGFDCDAVDSIVFGEDGHFFCTSGNGDYEENYCDYGCLCSGTNGLQVSGLADLGSHCGFFCVVADDGLSNAYSHYGSRLCYIPRTA